MTLSSGHKNIIYSVDQKVSKMIESGFNDTDILVDMLKFIPKIRTIIQTTDPKELDMYIASYPGFHHLARLLEKIAKKMAD